MNRLHLLLIVLFSILPLYINANTILFSSLHSLSDSSSVKNIFQMNEATNVQLSIQTYDGTAYTIIWENGEEVSAPSSSTQSYLYENPYSGTVKIIVDSFNIKKIILGGGFAFDIQQLYDFAPRLQSLTINAAGSACYGDLANKPTSLTYIDVQTGDFHGNFDKDILKNVKRLRVVKGNTISFNIADFDSSIIYIGVTGNNTASGYIDSLNYPKLNHFDVKGKNTITGDLGAIQTPLPRIFVLEGNNTVSQYSPGNLSFSASPKIFIFTGGDSSLSTKAIDDLLIDLDNVTTSWAKPRLLFLTGTHQAPSELSAAARASLIKKGAKVSTKKRK